MNRSVALILLVAALALTACNPDNIIPDQADWCYKFDFTASDPLSMTYGRWYAGVGYTTDENNHLGLTYNSPVTVNPMGVTIGVQKAADGDVSVSAAGNIFSINVSIDSTLPAALPWSEVVPVQLLAVDSNGIGQTANVTLQSSGAVVIPYMLVFGQFANPFGVDNCDSEDVDGEATTTPIPSDTPTAWPTSIPTNTPEPTVNGTPTPTPSETPTPTPSWSPTPSPTPTAYYYLSQSIHSTGGITCPYECYQQATVVVQPNARIVAVVLDGRNGSAVSNSQTGLTLNNQYVGPVGTPLFQNSGNLAVPGAVGPIAATYIAPLIPTNYPIYNIAGYYNAVPPGQVAKFAFYFWSNWTGGSPGNMYHDYRFVLEGWPTETPTPTPSPTGTQSALPTPTATLPLDGLTLTPSGPTFTPQPTQSGPTLVPTRTLIAVGPLPTVFNWATATAQGPQPTAQGTWSPIGTPIGEGTPFGTPWGTPQGTPGPGGVGTAVPGEYGDITALGNNVFGSLNNVMVLGSGWLSSLSARFGGIVNAWYTAPATAPPGVPLCASEPQENQFCAILYIIRYTLLSGPVGSLIMPLATVVVDLFLVFIGIRMMRAILARLARLVGG